MCVCFYYFPKILKISHFSSATEAMWPGEWVFNGVMVKWDNPKMTSISSSASYSKCATIYSVSHKLSIIFFHWLLYWALVLLGFRCSVCCCCCCRLSVQTNLLILILSHQMIEASARERLVRVRCSFIMLLNGWHHFLCLFLLNFDHVFYVNVCSFFISEFCLWLILPWLSNVSNISFLFYFGFCESFQ